MMVHTAPRSDAALDGTGTIVSTLPFVIPIQSRLPKDGVDQRRIWASPEGDDRTQCSIRFGLARIAGDVPFIKQTDELQRIPVPAQRLDDLSDAGIVLIDRFVNNLLLHRLRFLFAAHILFQQLQQRIRAVC